MLATNDKQYMDVIRMSSVTDEDGEVDWSAFFQGSSAYQKSYLQEIILSVLEDAESTDDVQRVMFVEEQKVAGAYTASATVARAGEQNDQAPEAQNTGPEVSEEEQKRAAEIAELRLNWSRNFLERGGFQHVLSQVYALDVVGGDRRQIEFMLTLVRVFLTAAFATDTNKDIGGAVKLARKSSSIDDGDTFSKKTKSEPKQDKLQELLRGELGMEILLSTNYARLQQKILELVVSVLQKEQLTLEEKIIVENAISVWVGSSLYRPELFDGFLSFTSGESTAGDLILSGLVFCREDKIRQDFCQGVLALARSIDVGKR